MVNKSLQNFYNEQAKKFSGTRKKDWPEFDIILEKINEIFKKKKTDQKSNPVKILEIGCGDGRFYRFLKNKIKDFEYTGVDFSQGLLDIAKQESPDGNRVCEDMIEFLKNQKQEEYDLIISIASIQHIENTKDRNFLIKLIHRSLKYGGKHISVNWAMSKSFQKKFQKEILNSKIKWIFSIGSWDKNNILVPFKNEDKIYKRLYHIFGQKEVKYLTIKNGLILSDCFFVGKDGKIVEEKNSRNIFFVQKKEITTQE